MVRFFFAVSDGRLQVAGSEARDEVGDVGLPLLLSAATADGQVRVVTGLAEAEEEGQHLNVLIEDTALPDVALDLSLTASEHGLVEITLRLGEAYTGREGRRKAALERKRSWWRFGLIR
jgi:hypothetical protein